MEIIDCLIRGRCAILAVRKVRAHKRRPTLHLGGANPPDQRGKEGDANVCYIFGFNPDRYLVGCPCQSHLRDFQGKEIAAHYSQ